MNDRHIMSAISIECRRGSEVFRRPALAGAVVLAVTLGGCGGGPLLKETRFLTPQERHPILIQEGSETLDIPVGINTARLSKASRQSIRGFAQGFKASQSGIIQVLVPSRSANETTAINVSGAVIGELRASGIPARAIERRSYPVQDPNDAAPVRLAYPTIKAKGPECGIWPTNIGYDPLNMPYENFGCATQRNLAAMIDEPADLIQPRGRGQTDTARKADAVEKYRQGQDPATRYSSIEDAGTVSEISD